MADREPLGAELPPVPRFELQLLPASLRPLVGDVAERMQVPLDFPGTVALLCLAVATNRRFAGIWQDMWACCKAFEHYGRLNPDDNWLRDLYCLDGLGFVQEQK